MLNFLLKILLIDNKCSDPCLFLFDGCQEPITVNSYSYRESNYGDGSYSHNSFTSRVDSFAYWGIFLGRLIEIIENDAFLYIFFLIHVV